MSPGREPRETVQPKTVKPRRGDRKGRVAALKAKRDSLSPLRGSAYLSGPCSRGSRPGLIFFAPPGLFRCRSMRRWFMTYFDNLFPKYLVSGS